MALEGSFALQEAFLCMFSCRLCAYINEAVTSYKHPPRIHGTICAASRKIRYDISVKVVFPQDKRSDSMFYQNRALPTIWVDYKPAEQLRCSVEVGWCLCGTSGLWQSAPIVPPHRESERQTLPIRNLWSSLQEECQPPGSVVNKRQHPRNRFKSILPWSNQMVWETGSNCGGTRTMLGARIVSGALSLTRIPQRGDMTTSKSSHFLIWWCFLFVSANMCFWWWELTPPRGQQLSWLDDAGGRGVCGGGSAADYSGCKLQFA